MKLLYATFSKITVLDDEFLFVAALSVVGVAVVLAEVLAVPPLATGGVLLGGVVGALFVSVWRTAHTR